MTAVEVRRSPAVVMLDIAAAAAVAAGLCLGALHLVQPGLDPGWSVVSQYALGTQGWVLSASFLLLAAACATLAAGLPADELRRAGRAGRVLLLVAALGLVLSSVFVIGSPVHDIGSLLGNAGLAVAAVLIGRDLRRGLPTPARRWSAVAAHAPWVAAVLMALFIATSTWGVGLLNRAVVLGYIVWIVWAARRGAARRPGG